MEDKDILIALKEMDLESLTVSLAIVEEYKRDRVARYALKYVQINEKLERRLAKVVAKQVERSNSVEPYSYDSPEPEEDLVQIMDYSETDFYKIFEELRRITPEANIVNTIDELVKAKADLIILRDDECIQVIGFKTMPESWKMKRDRGLIPLLFKENRFEDLEGENVFSISNTVDSIYFMGKLFILSKKEFEKGLNYREGLINNASELYQELEQSKLFINLDILKDKVGNNLRYLRKIAIIKNLGHYRNQTFLQKLKELSASKRWNITFQDMQLAITEENLENVLTVLQNKRLRSELTDEDFDVGYAKILTP